MEKEPLLPISSPRRQQGPLPSIILSPLPENGDFSLSLSPSELKDRLIFGPAIDSPSQSSSSSSVLEDLAFPSSSVTSSQSSEFHCLPFLTDSQTSLQQQQWLIDPVYTKKKTNLHKSRTVPAMAAINEIIDNHLHAPQPMPISQPIVSKSEYIIYKLKEMGKISDKDMIQICKKFDQLDTGNCGRITLADLMHSHL